MKTSRFAMKTENSTNAKCNNKNTKNIIQHFFSPYLCMLGITNITSLDTAICLIFAWKSNRHPTFGAIKSQDQCWPKKKKKSQTNEHHLDAINYHMKFKPSSHFLHTKQPCSLHSNCHNSRISEQPKSWSKYEATFLYHVIFQ